MTTPIPLPDSKLDIPLRRWIPISAESLAIFLILVLALVSRFYGLGARSISHDEVNHVTPAYSLYSGNGYKYDPLSHGPLQFHMMALSYALFGESDFTSRIPAAVFSVATIVLALLLLRPYLGRAGRLAAGVMFLISPFMLYYGRYERNEAFIVVWGLLLIYSILRYLEKGEARILVLFVLVNSIHFTDKATSYIFAAETLIFLTVYFVDRLLRREWPEEKMRSTFLLTLILAVVFLGGAAAVYLTQRSAGTVPTPLADAAQAAAQATQGVLDPASKVAIGVTAAAGLAALLYAAVTVVRGLGWSGVRSERSFDLLMLLGTLILPLLATLPVKLAGFDPLDFSMTGIEHDLVAILPLAVAAVLLGLWWKGRRWLLYALLFYLPIVILYTTFFTNPEGLAGAFMGALGYWMIQERGSQPLYYYALLQIPIYEFLPAVGTIAAAGIAIARRLWQSEPGRPFASGQTSEGEARQVPTVALAVFWSISSLVAFSLAGEKMPWLTIHIALPMILAAGWTVGWLVETVKWGKVREWAGRNYARASMLAFLALLGLITARAAFRAAFIFYDDPLEYLVYAHGTADTKALFQQVEEISRRTTGGLDIVVAYDNNVRYPYWWYMRHFPNLIDYDVNPTRDLRRAPIIFVSSENYDKIAPVVRNDYVESDYMRLWWPNQDYWSIEWTTIEGERTADLGIDASPMTVIDYLKYVWRHIQPFFTDRQVFNAVWQIWFNRDYTAWAALKNSDAYTLTNWGVSDRMRMYVRKDLASLIWSYGASPKAPAQTVDPYAAVTVPVTPDLNAGSPGSQPGQFQSPRGVAVAPDGSLYVADAGNNRIQHLDAQGQVIDSWGTFADVSRGAAPGGTFNEPWGVAVGPDGSVYVADTWNHRIQKFTAGGQFVAMWGHGPTDQADGFYGPRGVAVDAQGRVFVADTGNKRVLIFDPNGSLLGQVGSPGLDAGQFDEPVGVALDPAGKLYVSDTWNQRVQIFAPDASGLEFSPLAQWPVEGWFGQGLDNKPFIAADGQGDSFVTDPEACRVIEFSAGGQALKVWGGCGEPGGLSLPIGLALDGSGGLWVSDAATGTLVHFKISAP